ncbi:MAG: DUF1934 domain-containing protein [Halothermotrichaceae bacterium]
MKKKIGLNISNTQFFIDSEDIDNITYQSQGLLYLKNNKYYLIYNNNTQGFAGSRTKIKINYKGQKVSLLRDRPAQLRQFFEEGKKLKGFYQINAGKIKLETYTSEIDINIKKNKGDLFIKYSLFFNGQPTNKNQLKINWEIKGVE